MKFYGYPLHNDLSQPLALSEISFLGSEESLREVARFLIHCADEIGALPVIKGTDLHFHFQEFSSTSEIEGDIVIVPVAK